MNRTVKNSMIYLGGTAVMGILGFFSTMLLTRILSQQVYAMYGLLTTFITAVDMFIAFGYDQSYMRFYYSHDRSAKRFMWECIKVPLLLFLLFALVVAEPRQNLISLVFGERLTRLAIAALLLLAFFSVIHRFGQLTVRMGEFAGNYVVSNVVSKFGFVAVVFILAVALGEVTFEWIVISSAILTIAATVINLVVFQKLANLRNTKGKAVAGKELLQYGFPYMINNVMVLVIPVSEKIIIRNLAGWEVLSVFTAASIFQTVVMMVLNAINNIWNPLVYKHCEDEKVFKPILHTFGLVGTLTLAFGTATCILLRRWLVLLLDEKYYAVYIIAPVILLTACYNILATIFSVGIDIRKKTVHFIVAPVLQIVTSVGLCSWLIPTMGLPGVGISILVSVGISRFYRILMGLHYYHTGVPETKTFLICMICTIAAAASMFLTTLLYDVLISAAVLVLVCIIANKDILTIAVAVLGYIRHLSPRSKSKQANLEINTK